MKVHAAYHAVRGRVLIWLFRGVGRAFQGASCGKREGISFFIPSAPFPPKARGRRGFAVSGSGPGFFFEYVAAYEEAAVALGFTPEQAKLLVRQTFSGSLALLAATGESPRGPAYPGDLARRPDQGQPRCDGSRQVPRDRRLRPHRRQAAR